jgi:hypothetical protein
MTERKPTGMSFRSWIDQQISEAADRGAFDNLPGAGKPLPRRNEEDAAAAWLRDYLDREGVAAEEMLPTPLKLRKQAARLTEAVPGFRSEQELRAVIGELNEQIMQWRRLPLGPPIFVPLVDEQALVGSWRASRPAPPPAPENAPAGGGEPARTRRWRRRPGR